MKNLITCLFMLLLIFMCSCNENNSKNVTNEKRNEVCAVPKLKVYNMGGAPAEDVRQLTLRLKEIYPNTVSGGSIELADSALIKNDAKGENRYWNNVLMNHIKKVTDTKNDYVLVVVNADICNMTKNGSHANMGMSLLGKHLSLISYQRLKINNLNTVNNMLKVALHELGHSVCSLVKDHRELRFHCPDKNCMMLDAQNKFPYRNITGFCPVCDSVMNAHGFITSNMKL